MRRQNIDKEDGQLSVIAAKDAGDDTLEDVRRAS
jgi:hypothetical protein